jgi:hypothetical protein
MGMRDGDGRDSAHRLGRFNHGFVRERQAIPEDVRLRRPQEQGPLANGELRSRSLMLSILSSS